MQSENGHCNHPLSALRPSKNPTFLDDVRVEKYWLRII